MRSEKNQFNDSVLEDIAAKLKESNKSIELLKKRLTAVTKRLIVLRESIRNSTIGESS